MTRSHADKPVTVERIEAALDSVAGAIVKLGGRGEELLPLYDRLEDELRALRAKEDRLAAIRQRARRSTDRTATPTA
jgi:hypothetical protein